MRFTTILGTLAAATALWSTPTLAADEIVVGFATAASGFMQAYDKPAQDAALIRIDEINKAGGLLGKKIKPVFADTKTDQAEGAKAGLAVLDQGAELVIVSCDYDFGAPAALQAQSAGKVSFFLCAESIKAGIPGVGPYSFSGSVLAAVQGATMAEWAYKKKNARNFYRLLDSWTVYNKGICDGFDWMMPRLKDAALAGSDTFKNDDAVLFPNQFVNVQLLVDTHRGVILLPNNAIQRNDNGAFVYLVQPNQTAALKPITVGTTDGNTSEVQGLQPGLIVAADSFNRLSDGTKVTIRPSASTAKSPAANN